jgi:hypothetical protein
MKHLLFLLFAVLALFGAMSAADPTQQPNSKSKPKPKGLPKQKGKGNGKENEDTEEEEVIATTGTPTPAPTPAPAWCTADTQCGGVGYCVDETLANSYGSVSIPGSLGCSDGAVGNICLVDSHCNSDNCFTVGALFKCVAGAATGGATEDLTGGGDAQAVTQAKTPSSYAEGGALALMACFAGLMVYKVAIGKAYEHVLSDSAHGLVEVPASV